MGRGCLSLESRSSRIKLGSREGAPDSGGRLSGKKVCVVVGEGCPCVRKGGSICKGGGRNRSGRCRL